MGGDGSRESADESVDNDIQDAVPPEWIRAVEREKVAAEAAWQAKRRRRRTIAAWLVPALVLSVVAITWAVVWNSRYAHQPPAVLPSAVQAFARTLPESQRPNAAGVAVVDATDAPSTWRIAWETQEAAFCFAFVHESEPPQTLCDAPGSVSSAPMRIGGELDDTGLDPPELFTCGYTTGPAVEVGYAEINNGEVVGAPADMGSGLSAYCLQLPYDTAAGASFTDSTSAVIVQGLEPKDDTVTGVTATYR